jgi:hypothetical protein
MTKRRAHCFTKLLSSYLIFRGRQKERPCYFLNLPREIRDEIYTYIFGDSISGYQANPLLLVCKQLHHEARKIIIEKVAVRISPHPTANAVQKNWLRTAKHLNLCNFQPGHLNDYEVLGERTDLQTLKVQVYGWVYMRALKPEKAKRKVKEWQRAIALLLEIRLAKITFEVAELWPIPSARSLAYSTDHYPYKVAFWKEVAKGSLQASSYYSSKWWWWDVTWSVLKDGRVNTIR